MIRIEHIAIWSKDIEQLRIFYEKYFDAKANALYHNPKKNFKSYFLSFADGARLEIMQMPTIENRASLSSEHHGLAHFAVSVGSKERVNSLTETFRSDGFTIAGEPRTTGDGYYESVILDPEGNRIEITI